MSHEQQVESSFLDEGRDHYVTHGDVLTLGGGRSGPEGPPKHIHTFRGVEKVFEHYRSGRRSPVMAKVAESWRHQDLGQWAALPDMWRY